MPFKITTEFVTQPKSSGNGPTETSSRWVHPVPYICLDVVGHVRIHPESPGEGVAVTPMASHPIVVCQAHTTGRTVVNFRLRDSSIRHYVEITPTVSPRHQEDR